MNISRTLPRTAALLAVAALSLTGCTATAVAESPHPTHAGDVVTIEDAWVRAAPDGMSAAFGTLKNAGSQDVTVVSVASDTSSRLELHETTQNDAADMVMREVEGGFVIPRHGELTLEPGGDHIMLMDLTHPLIAGDEASFTLTFSDDSTYEFTAPVKDYTGASDHYEGHEHEHEHEGMDH